MEDEELEEGGEKIFGQAEMILVTLATLIGDILDLAEFGVPFTDIILFPFLQIYFRKKGVPAVYSWIGNGAEVIPGVDYLPLRTAAVLATMIAANRHPNLLQAAALATGKAGGIKGLETVEGQAVAENALRAEKLEAERLSAFKEGRPNPSAPKGWRDLIEEGGGGFEGYERGEEDYAQGPASSGRVVTEEDFGMPKDNPLEAARDELFSVDVSRQHPSRTWGLGQNDMAPAGTEEPEEGDEAGDDLEDRLDTGISQLRHIADNKEVLDTMSEIPQDKDSKDDGETLDLRKAA